MATKTNTRYAIAVRKLRTAASLPLRTALLAALLWLALWPMRLIILVTPTRFLVAPLGEDISETRTNEHMAGHDGDAGTSPSVRRLAVAMGLAARYHPLSRTCYAQAILAHLLLSRLKEPHSTFFGVRRGNPGSALEAHAWVLAGSTVVSGGKGQGNYTIVRRFFSS